MRTQVNPVKKTNFEENELKARKQKTNKTQRTEGKKLISKMIEEDQEIENAMFVEDLEKDNYYFGIDWAFDLIEFNNDNN